MSSTAFPGNPALVGLRVDLALPRDGYTDQNVGRVQMRHAGFSDSGDRVQVVIKNSADESRVQRTVDIKRPPDQALTTLMLVNAVKELAAGADDQTLIKTLRQAIARSAGNHLHNLGIMRHIGLPGEATVITVTLKAGDTLRGRRRDVTQFYRKGETLLAPVRSSVIPNPPDRSLNLESSLDVVLTYLNSIWEGGKPQHGTQRRAFYDTLVANHEAVVASLYTPSGLGAAAVAAAPTPPGGEL